MATSKADMEHVFELLGEMRAEQRAHGEKLHRIEIQTTKTNGSVAECFRQIEAHDIEFRDVKALINATRGPVTVVPSVESKDADAMVVRIPRSLWAKALAAFGGLSIFAPLIYRWLEKRLGL